MRASISSRRRALLTSAAAPAIALALWTGQAAAQEQAKAFAIAPQPLADALLQFSRQANVDIVASADLTRGRTAPQVTGDMTSGEALGRLLAGTGLTAEQSGNAYVIAKVAQGPQSGSAAGDGAEVEALIVTAQKREEDIQDVPIAISAFTQEDLERSQVATGADLMTQVPNMTFTKTNFTSYSIQLRGIGTQAISATIDPAVAVAFNNTPFLRAHFFEQEFYDLQRVEVLRGPQGTLYGRNATAGVVNLISQKPRFNFEAKASADISNYDSRRIEGMLNLPLVEDKVALRLAGAWTKREGYTTNELTGNPIDGRDLWSTRVSLRIDPNDRLSANLIWEHFEEDDDRLRSGKQTCHRAEIPEEIDGVSTDVGGNGVLAAQRYLAQGCLPSSVYSPDAFQTPNGLTLGYYLPLGELGAPINGNQQWDVYASDVQSRDLRVIESQVEPIYRASSDTVELNVDLDLSDSLTLTSQTGYATDLIFSSQDYNRFNTRAGAFEYCDRGLACGLSMNNSNGRLLPSPVGLIFGAETGELFGQPCDVTLQLQCYTPGIFCDPQIGCSDRLVLMDLATARSRQFSQEFRVSSSFEGRFNFSLGANYLRYKTLEDYYVFINSITLTAARFRYDGDGEVVPWVPGVTDNAVCLSRGFGYVNPFIPTNPQSNTCAYIDPNPITDLNGQGHNYFRNQNPYKLQSYAVFGEAYYDITDNLKLTAGLRWTVDKKHFDSIPSQLLVEGYGYPKVAEIDQEWTEPSGRLVLNWKPDLAATDETMVYGSYTHGYKAGGANPPGAALLVNRGGDIPFPTHPETFEAEFVDALELGTKNTLLEGALTLNLTGFYYDYQGYQISEIVDRSAINTNFDATVWGAELETDWRPLENLRFGLKVGYEDTAIADGQSRVDLMDRTAGTPGWMVVKPFPTQASNCILPTYVVATLLPQTLNLSSAGVPNACTFAYLGRDGVLLDPVTALPYTPNPTDSYYNDVIPADYPGFNPVTAPNRGAGFSKDLSGNQLPNAPHWTGTLTADYTLPLPSEWLMTLHSDLYYQSEAWARVFNMEGYDKLKAYTNVNVAAIFSNEDLGWIVMAYVKNVLDKDNITGAFLNSDDTGLTTNVFLNEPRLYGLRVTKNWSGSPWWGASGPAASLPIRVELEGYHGDFGNGHNIFRPSLDLTDQGVDLFPDDLEFPAHTQNDIAAGNGGGVRLTYQPAGAAWRISGAARYGRAGGGTHQYGSSDVGETCLVEGKYCWNPGGAPEGDLENKYNWRNVFETTTESEESHTFVDFQIGADFGLGGLLGRNARSTLSGGIAYANFRSTSESILRGTPDMIFPDSFYVYNGSDLTAYTTEFHRFNDAIRADREFEGVGPKVNWDLALRLFGEAVESGQLDLELGAGATILYGKQKSSISGRLKGYEGGGPWFSPGGGPPQEIYDTVLDYRREISARVPGAMLNFGLGYTLGHFKLSGGYRWERYYKAVDGGIEHGKKYDRTIDGPYFKISVGFGG